MHGWRWAERLWALFAACVIATAIRSPTTRDFRHLVDDVPLANLTLGVAAAAGLATALACRKDRAEPGRPDAVGTRALGWAGVSVFVCCAIGALETPITGGCMVFPLIGEALLPLALGPAGLLALWALRADLRRDRAWTTLGALMGLFAVLVGLMENKVSIARRLGYQRSTTRACYANQKTLVGAMEMYNLDHNTKRLQLDAPFFQALRSGGYLQSIPSDPGQMGPGTSSHYQDTATGNGVRCTVHGAIQ